MLLKRNLKIRYYLVCILYCVPSDKNVTSVKIPHYTKSEYNYKYAAIIYSQSGSGDNKAPLMLG